MEEEGFCMLEGIVSSFSWVGRFCKWPKGMHGVIVAEVNV